MEALIESFSAITSADSETARAFIAAAHGDANRAMDLYFERHDGQAVTCDDFRAAMADANGADLTQFERWYTQAGTPTVTAAGAYDAAAKRRSHT